MHVAPRRAPLASAALLALAASGCVVGDLWRTRESERALAAYGWIGGSVEPADGSEGWLVVLVAQAPCDEDWSLVRDALARGDAAAASADPQRSTALERGRGKMRIVQHVVLERPGAWYARLAPGCYAVGAFEDLDRDYRYRDEPALAPVHADRLIELAAGARREGLALVIPRDGRFGVEAFDPLAEQARALAVRAHDDQVFASLDAVAVDGQVASLADPRFGEESGRLGFFDIHAFAWRLGPGIYFLDAYDPAKVPVLFVHGAMGFPQNFDALIAGLDRTRFQPWVFFYPSGARLEAVAHFLAEQVARLGLRHGFERMAVVAHSMGGLVARAFILAYHERARRDPIELFVSYSTPWEGVASAGQGVERSPVIVPSWRDVAPGSAFLRGLFFADPERTRPRRLPGQVAHQLIFGVRDETISVPSAVSWPAVREARERWPLPYGHVEILSSPEASQLLNESLARAFE
jgi:pimeloyl-ACP methyl ester carboxylesterase